MRLRKIIRAAITVAFGRVGVTRRAEAAPPCPGSYAFLTDSRQIVEAFSKANRLLGRDENAFLGDLLEVLDATEVDLFQRAVTSTGTQSALERKVRDLVYGTASCYREVGTLAHLFTRIRRKGVSPLEYTEFNTTNQRRLIVIAQMQQIAQELHDDIVTTAPDDRADVKAIRSANKLNTLLSDALLTLALKTVTDTANVRVLELFSRSLERFSSSYFDDKEKADAADSTPIMQQWSRYQVRNTEPLANAFECSLLLAGANSEELSAARQCGNDLALAIQAIKELDLFLNRECHGPLGDPRSLPAILAQEAFNKASEVRRQCCGSSSEAEAEKSQREQRDIVDGMIGVIRRLTDGVLGYVADCEASEASEALRDIAAGIRNT